VVDLRDVAMPGKQDMHRVKTRNTHDAGRAIWVGKRRRRGKGRVT